MRNNLFTRALISATFAVAILTSLFGGAIIAHADEDVPPANVHMVWPANIVGPMESTSANDSAGRLYRLADYEKWAGGPLTDGLKAELLGREPTKVLKPTDGGNISEPGVNPGDYALIIVNGEKTWLMRSVVQVAPGNLYPGNTHHFTWSGQAGRAAPRGSGTPDARLRGVAPGRMGWDDDNKPNWPLLALMGLLMVIGTVGLIKVRFA